MKQYAEELWTDVLKKRVAVEEIEHKSRSLQDQIYDNWCSNHLVLVAVYKLLQLKNNAQMQKSAKELVDEALQSKALDTNP